MGEQNLPRLIVSKEYAETKIERQLEKGRWLRTDRRIDSDEELDKVRLEANNWSNHNEALLVKLFDQGPAIGYTRYHYGQRSVKEIRGIIDNSLIRIDDWFEYETDEFRSDMMISIGSLEGIYDRLELYENASNTREQTLGDKVFVGHGRSPCWRDLQDFIVDTLQLPCDEFNRVPTAGMTIQERLEQMLDEACIAFLVMTGEDEQPDGKVRARMNVIHEVGLFQGRLGFKKAIILLEDECETFSNIHGVLEIRFSKGDIRATFEEIREVMEREGVLG